MQNRSWTRWDPNPKVNPALKKLWDPKQSAEANLASFGLVARPNTLPNRNDSAQAVTPDPTKRDAVIELFDVPESDKPSRSQRFPLSQVDEEYIAKCLAKYGDDYTRMFRDIKVNNMQHTEHVLRKLGSRFLLLSPEQRRVEVPEKVLHLLPGTVVENSE